MSASLNLVILRTQNSRECVARRPLATSDIYQIQTYHNFSIFGNKHGIFKVTEDDVIQVDGSPCNNFALSTGGDRLVFFPFDESQALTECDIRDTTVFEPVPSPLMPAMGFAVRQIACGVEHCLTLMRHGIVMAWGRGPQLGLGVAIDGDVRGPHITEPQPVPGIRDAIFVAAGAYHSSVIVIGGSNTRSDDTESSGEAAPVTNSIRTTNHSLASASDSNDALRLKVQLGLSSFIFRASNSECRRDGGLLERLRGVRRWSVSVTSEDGRADSPHSGSSGPYDQLMCDRAATPSSDSLASTSDLRAESDIYVTLDENSIGAKSLPGLSWMEEEMRSHLDELAVDTEVWMWGSGKAGQLGLGTTDDAAKPTRLQNLPSIVKVACGQSHCLALTADSKVYLWGTYHKTKRALVPQLVETGSDLIFDVAAGNCASLIIGYITYQPDVFMLDKDRLPVRKTELRGVGWPVCLATTFDSPMGDGHCLVSQPDSQEQANLYEAIHELSFKLRSLFSHLHNLKLSFVDSFTNICTFDDETPLSNRWILLLNGVSMLHRTTHSCVGVATRRCLATLDSPFPDPLEIAALERSLSRQLDAFRFFAHTLANVVSWNSFDMLLRWRPAESNEALSHFVQPLPPLQERASALRDAFTAVFVLMEMQHAQVERLAQLAPDFTAVVSDNLAADNVASIHRHAKENLSGAMETCAMVETLPTVVQTRLSSRPERRLVLDSNTCPLSTSNKSGRPSSGQRLLLFTDALVLVASSQTTVWPLSVMWVRSTKETQEDPRGSLRNSTLTPEPNIHSLQVTTPDEEVKLYAQDETARARWFSTINREINRSLFPRGTLNARPSISQIAPERRYGQFTFRKGPFRGCRYDGQWSRGLMHGEGQLTWPDGCLHQGRFHRGHVTGFGRRETKSPARVMEGQWDDGLLHGYGTVTYDEDGLKSQYTGWFSRGLREGHGVLRSGSDYLYMGEWSADKQNGYGVEENYSPTPYRFFGEWRQGLKHGNGSLVTLTNRFLEGIFVNGEMRGLGRIVDADFEYKGQIINEKPNGAGVCVFKTSSGRVRLTGRCFGVSDGKLSFEGDVEWEELSPQEVLSTNRNSVYQYQTENVEQNVLPNRWNAILSHCEEDLGSGKDEEDDNVERRRSRAWSSLASLILASRRRWKKARRGSTEQTRAGREPRWSLLECIPMPTNRLDKEYVSRAREYFLAAVELIEHPLGLYVRTMVGLIKEAYLGMGTHPQLLRHAREDVWITAKGLYRLLRRLFPLLPADLDQKTPFEELSDSNDGDDQTPSTDGERCECHFVGRNFVYDLLLPRVYPCLRTLYATTLTAEEEAYRRTLRKHNRIGDTELFTLLEISGDIRERLAPEYDVVGEAGRLEQTLRYLPIVKSMQSLNFDDVCSPQHQLMILMSAYDDMLKMITANDSQPSSADVQVPVMLFLLIRANITHLGATLAYIRDMAVFPCDCDRGAMMYKFTTILGLYRHLVDRNGTLY